METINNNMKNVWINPATGEPFMTIHNNIMNMEVAYKIYNLNLKQQMKYQLSHKDERNGYRRKWLNKVYSEKGEAYDKIKEAQRKYIASVDINAYNRQKYAERKARKLAETQTETDL